MKIRTALTLKYTCVTATIFLLCTALIYLVSEHTRDRTFFRNLKSEGVTKAHLFLAGQVDAQTMQSVYLNNKKFINEVEWPSIRPISKCSITMPSTTTSSRRRRA